MSHRFVLVASAALLLVAVAAPVAAARDGQPLTEQAHFGARIPVFAGRTTQRHAPIQAPTRVAKGPDGEPVATADIQVNYIGFSAPAQQAFEAAVVVWEGLITSSQVIYVDAYWEDLGNGGILGSAGPKWVYRDGGPWYPGPIFEARCECPMNTDGQPDIEASFNSSFDAWYLGTDGNPPFNDYDFYTVVLHELGHGLGFISSFWVTGGLGYWGIEFGGNNYPMTFDEREVTAASGGTPLISYANGSTALKNQLTDGSVYFAGPNVIAALGGPAELYAPGPWEGGSSNSHLDEDSYPTGSQHALMTPQVANSEVIHDPGPLTLAVFRDIGWTTVDGPPIDAEAPVVGMPTASLFAPQVLGTNVGLRVTWPEATDPSGIDSYELQRKKGTGSWVSVPLPSPTATQADVMVVPGSKYAFRVRATDGANNVGAWTIAAARKLALHQETSTAVTYAGTFKSSAVSGASGGYVRQTSVGGRYARLSFTGTSATFITTLAAGRGIAEIWLDGSLVATLDLYSASSVKKAVAWASGALSPGSHTVDVVVTGTRNPSATKNRIDIDAFLAWP